MCMCMLVAIGRGWRARLIFFEVTAGDMRFFIIVSILSNVMLLFMKVGISIYFINLFLSYF